MTSARKLKQVKTAFTNRHLVGVISVDRSGDVTLHLPRRRKPITLSKSEAEVTQALLATLDRQSTVGYALSLDPSLTTCAIDIHA